MRIGAFSKQFAISPETVRYYVNKGLLCPIIKNDRYDFKENDKYDMQLLLRLKSFRFSIGEIHKLLSLRRLSNFDSQNELDDYIDILVEQKNKLQHEKHQLQGIINSLQDEIGNSSGKHSFCAKRKNGVPLVFLQLLACPVCGGSLRLNNCSIEKDQILSGALSCECGFEAVIQNGILIGPPGKISKYDWPDVERNCYRLMNPTLVSYMQKAYHWLLDRIGQCDMDGKVILEDFVNNYCFCHANFEYMPPKALYIISDKYPEIVTIYKGLIDKLGLESKVLYIAAASNMLPLKDGCVDMYIDFDSANEYALYHKGYSIDALARYLRRESYAAGSFFSFKANSSAKKELYRQFPESWEHSYDIAYFKRYLRSTWTNIIDEESIGNVIDSNTDEKAKLYHINGEVGMDVYFVSGFEGKVKEDYN